MTDTRSYRQNCSLALGLDLIGERWTMLIVRELARGPKRFGELKDALPGLGASMLAARLKRLQQAEVVEHTELAGGVAGYGLADRGERLAVALGDLMLWGLELQDTIDPGYQTRAAWLAMNMQAALRRSDEPAPPGTYAFAIGDERFYIHIGEHEITLRDGTPPHPPDASLTAPPRTFYALATGTPLDNVDTEIHGDHGRMQKLLAWATLPEFAR